MDPKTQIAVVGATGVIGKEILAGLAERRHPADRLTLLASERSGGEELEYGDDTLEVEIASPEALRRMDVVFLATPPDVSKLFAPAAQAQGAWIVDTSSAFRMEAGVRWMGLPFEPPVHRPAGSNRIVSVATPSTAMLALVLEALSGFHAVDLSATVLFGASARGMAGVRELEQQTAQLLSGKEPEVAAFPHRLAFNLIPEVGTVSTSGWSQTEASLIAELHRLHEGRERAPRVHVQACWMPTFYSVFAAGTVRLEKPAALPAIKERFKETPGLKLIDAPEEHAYPLPQLTVGDPDVQVGRLRLHPASPTEVSFVAAVDNAGWTAKAAVEAAERVLARVEH